MLAYGRVHGDLSAYNILYWDGRSDPDRFPAGGQQPRRPRDRHVLDSTPNPDAYDILARDVVRVCDYFGRYGQRVDGPRLAAALWSQYSDDNFQERLADASRFDE